MFSAPQGLTSFLFTFIACSIHSPHYVLQRFQNTVFILVLFVLFSTWNPFALWKPDSLFRVQIKYLLFCEIFPSPASYSSLLSSSSSSCCTILFITKILLWLCILNYISTSHYMFWIRTYSSLSHKYIFAYAYFIFSLGWRRIPGKCKRGEWRSSTL